MTGQSGSRANTVVVRMPDRLARRLSLANIAEISPRTFWNFAREFSSFSKERLRESDADPRHVLPVYSGDGAIRSSRAVASTSKGPWSRWSEGGRLSVIIRPRRLMGAFRRQPIGWPERGPGVRRPRVTSGLLEPRFLCLKDISSGVCPRNAAGKHPVVFRRETVPAQQIAVSRPAGIPVVPDDVTVGVDLARNGGQRSGNQSA